MIYADIKKKRQKYWGGEPIIPMGLIQVASLVSVWNSDETYLRFLKI